MPRYGWIGMKTAWVDGKTSRMLYSTNIGTIPDRSAAVVKCGGEVVAVLKRILWKNSEKVTVLCLVVVFTVSIMLGG